MINSPVVLFIATNYDSLNDAVEIRDNVTICDQLDSLAINASVETTGVTSFAQEACTLVTAMDSSLAKSLYPVQADIQDLTTYFARPMAIRQGDLPTGVRGVFSTISNDTSSILGSWPSGAIRMKGVYGFRATLVYTLQIAATPFHQGLVALAYQYGNVGALGYYNRFSDACTVTNLPHVILDLSVDSMVQLKVPYILPYEYAIVPNNNVGNSQFEGTVGIAALTAIPTVPGLGPPAYQLYVHLEDLELYGAVPNEIVTIVNQGGKKMGPITDEFEKDSHPFSSALYTAGKTLSFIAKGIPALSSLTGPPIWALGKAARLARHYGFGKPQVVDPLMRMYKQDNVGEFNTDVATGCMVVAATANNTTIVDPGLAASDVDEMSLKFITSRWSQICVFDFGTSDAPATLLYSTPISPMSWWFRAKPSLPASNIFVRQQCTSGSNSIQPSHLMFAVNSFRRWRGGVKLRFTFVKTKMHSGRVMVSYNPYRAPAEIEPYMTSASGINIPAYGTVGLGPSLYGYSAVFDLKDGNVFEFQVPYVSPHPYSKPTDIIGALAMYVVNPLLASSVVSSTISVLVEVCGDSDFEVSNPCGVLLPVHNAGTIALQSGKLYSETDSVLNQHTMGEEITSVKQLIAIPHQFTGRRSINTPVNYQIPPWFFAPNYSPLVPSIPGTYIKGSCSYGGVWASCYSFMRGATDFHLYDFSKDTTIVVSQNPLETGNTRFAQRPWARGNSSAPVLTSNGTGIHSRLPGFFPLRRMWSYVANSIVPARAAWGDVNFNVPTSSLPSATLGAFYTFALFPKDADFETYSPFFSFSTNASDDAQLGMYIGPPPLYLLPDTDGSDTTPPDLDSLYTLNMGLALSVT